MNKILTVISICAALFASNLQATETDKWYHNGDLHNKSLTTWHKATYQNKLASSANILVAVTTRYYDILLFVGPDAVKPAADELVDCIDTLSLDDDYWHRGEVSRAAVICMMQKGWNKGGWRRKDDDF